MKFIESVYCSLQNINPDILHTKTRKREIVEARHSIIALTICYRGKKGLSYDNIADYYNYKEHSSVNYARKTVDILSDVQPSFKNRIEECKKEIEPVLLSEDRNQQIEKYFEALELFKKASDKKRVLIGMLRPLKQDFNALYFMASELGEKITLIENQINAI